MNNWNGQVQKTWKGKTAYKLLKNCKLEEMEAGNIEIITEDLPDMIIRPLENCYYNQVQINSREGIEMILRVSTRLYDKLMELYRHADYLMANK